MRYAKSSMSYSNQINNPK